MHGRPLENTPPVKQSSQPYQQRIEALKQTKIEHTELKLKQRGYFDIDDHGYIPWSEPIPFKAKPNHPSGGCYGPKCIGENFRAYMSRRFDEDREFNRRQYHIEGILLMPKKAITLTVAYDAHKKIFINLYLIQRYIIFKIMACFL